MRYRTTLAAALLAAAASAVLHAQAPATGPSPDWARVEAETIEHFQALLRMDTSDPPGNERPAAEYLKRVLEREGIPVQLVEPEPNRVNVIARLTGTGRRKPVVFMAHTDVVTVDPKKWTFPPFSGTLNGGYIYGRGAIDDKDNVVATLMTMVLLKRLNVPLARDVIFLAEAGEEGTTRVGINFMVERHYGAIDAEYCLAEGGSVTRTGGQVKYASVQTLEKIPRALSVTARGPPTSSGWPASHPRKRPRATATS